MYGSLKVNLKYSPLPLSLHLLGDLDEDGNGSIDFAEFVDMMVKKMKAGIAASEPVDEEDEELTEEERHIAVQVRAGFFSNLGVFLRSSFTLTNRKVLRHFLLRR